MKWHVTILLGLAVSAIAVSSADAQGYYRNGVRRNPLTGAIEIVDYGYSRLLYGDPYYRGFRGTTLDPVTGSITSSRVSRNPFTGRLEVDNTYFNPWTGAQYSNSSRYNPYTRRYEGNQSFVPPPQPIGVSGQAPAEEPPKTAVRRGPLIIDNSQGAQQEPDQRGGRRGPLIIETPMPSKADDLSVEDAKAPRGF